ncbi:MAG: cyclic pyranopterin monophosphate synthase MoaC [Bacillus sp. (in: firmicutes)]
MSDLTHFNEQGRARMVDISDKAETARTAVAKSSVTINQAIYQQIIAGSNKKGDVLAVAQVAGIMAAKQTSSIIPMCHPIALTGVNIAFDWQIDELNNKYEILIQAEVKTKGSTGVEMEALTAVSTAALTIYDMCKALDKQMVIGPTMLIRKTGGKNGDFLRRGFHDLE